MSDSVCGGIPCLWMRGGTSKGVFFRAADLPDDEKTRNALLLRIMGSPDPAQIDGIGGGDPLTSKVAILYPSSRPDADIDYLFLQVFVDQPLVVDTQGCGNILAAVGPAAIELGLFPARETETVLRIHMMNTGETATARIKTPGGIVSYEGSASIDGVPANHAPIPLLFEDLAGSMCGSLLPTGSVIDQIEGFGCTLIDNGMPCVILQAEDFGISGNESREYLDSNADLKTRLEAIRLTAGRLMGLEDVRQKSIPKMVLVAPPENGGVISTRSFIPHRCHASIGVFAAISVATACLLEGSPASLVARLPENETFRIEHPSGAADVLLTLEEDRSVASAGVLRTARKLMSGNVFPGPE
ncbi:4-oxalomesaconate tautomerase [Roseibium sp. SCP14]|uniref:4-oxalomesaconate tautomerase n=1 Tax=Roseibium sp. SCP14 TaxID=3141375 RepID=UPI00333C634F